MSLKGANEYYKKQAMNQGYSDVRTREMLRADLHFLYAAPATQDPQAPSK